MVSLNPMAHVSGARSGTLIMTKGIIRFLQFVLALSLIGVYAAILAQQPGLMSLENVGPHFKYPLAVAVIACLSALICSLPFRWLFVWDAIVAILFFAAFGDAARIWLLTGLNAVVWEGINTPRMKSVMWLSLVNALLWVVSFFLGIGTFLLRERNPTVVSSKMSEVEHV